MNDQSSRSIAELLADRSIITEAIRRAVREAVLKHARAGQPVATMQNGKVVWVAPEDVLARLAGKATP